MSTEQNISEHPDPADPNYLNNYFELVFGRKYNEANEKSILDGLKQQAEISGEDYEVNLYEIKLACLPGAVFDEKLQNYCYNMIYYYETRIKDVEKLIDKMSVGSGLSFAADLAIMDQQANGIDDIIDKEESLRSIDESTKKDAIKKYKEQVGSRSSDVMNKDYDNRNRTIRYTLLINEYKEKIKTIKQELSIYGAPPIEAIKKDVVASSDENNECSWPTDCTNDLIQQYLAEHPESLLTESGVNEENNINKISGGNRKYTRHNYVAKPQIVNKTRKNTMIGGIVEINKTLEQLGELDKKLSESGSIIAMDPVFNVAYNSILFTINYIKSNNLLVSDSELYDFLYDDVSTLKQIGEKYIREIYESERLNDMKTEGLTLVGGSKPSDQSIEYIKRTIASNPREGFNELNKEIDRNNDFNIKGFWEWLAIFIDTKLDLALTTYNRTNDVNYKLIVYTKLYDIIERLNSLNNGYASFIFYDDNGNSTRMYNVIHKAKDKLMTSDNELARLYVDLSRLVDTKNNAQQIQQKLQDKQVKPQSPLSNRAKQEDKDDDIDIGDIDNIDVNTGADDDVDSIMSKIKGSVVNPCINKIKQLWSYLRNLNKSETDGNSQPKISNLNQISAGLQKPPEPDKLQPVQKEIWNKLPQNLKNKVMWGLDPESLNKQFDILNKEHESQEMDKKKIEEISSAITAISKEYEPVINQFTELAKQYSVQLQKLQKQLDEQDLIIKSSDEKIFSSRIKITEGFENIINTNDDNNTLELEIFSTVDLSRTEFLETVTPINEFQSKIDNLYIKKQLYYFTKTCDELDSVPQWRSMLVRLIYSYMKGFLISPNVNPSTGKKEPLQNKPGYQYFNIILKGNPGIGKSYSSEKIGLALMYSGLLTKGKLIPIKKPEIIGQYTGQTAPKVYSELSGSMGNIVFLDEAYSIAGKMDETKGTYNEFGQEALDAITDFTSEHIGLFGIVAAGYAYEMQKQFLDVNIGLPRRFPTVLTLNRYDMNSYWKIIKGSLIKISPVNQVNEYHRACFEILNILFNNGPQSENHSFLSNYNPLLKLSKNFDTLYNSLIQQIKLGSINVNLQFNDVLYPVISLTAGESGSYNNKSSNNVSFVPFEKYITGYTDIISGKKQDLEIETTASFLKSFFLFLYTGLLNGDPFRSQADNLTKFGETILNDKIFNGGKKFESKLEQDNVMNFAWIEYIYFKLYFLKNPNNISINNIEYVFENRDELESQMISKMTEIIKFSESRIRDIPLVAQLKQLNNKRLTVKTKALYNESDEERKKKARLVEPDLEKNDSIPPSVQESIENTKVPPPQPSEVNTQKSVPINREEAKKILTDIYKVHEPSKLVDVEMLLNKYTTGEMKDKGLDVLIKRAKEKYTQGGGAQSKLSFNITVTNLGNKDDLIQRVINAHIKLFKFNAGEDIEKDKITAESNIISDLLGLKFKTNRLTDIDTLYLFIILSAYITACEEYIRPESAFKTDGWWFFDKAHFEKIIRVLDIKKIIEIYNSTVSVLPVPTAEVIPPSNEASTGVSILSTILGVNQPNLTSPSQPIDNTNPSLKRAASEGGNKTRRPVYKTVSGKLTRNRRYF
jgi:hypothetical protein